MSYPFIKMPDGVVLDETSNSERFGRFVVQPLERGYGVTLGNALRRVLLSSLSGAAITAVKIEGVLHEFSTIPGVVEDVTELILNLKKVRMRISNKKIAECEISLSGSKEFKAGDRTEGVVVRVADFGVIVELGPKIDGMVHVSEIAPFRIDKVETYMKLGMKVPILVKGLDDKGRLKLSIKDADPNFIQRK